MWAMLLYFLLQHTGRRKLKIEAQLPFFVLCASKMHFTHLCSLVAENGKINHKFAIIFLSSMNKMYN